MARSGYWLLGQPSGKLRCQVDGIVSSRIVAARVSCRGDPTEARDGVLELGGRGRTIAPVYDNTHHFIWLPIPGESSARKVSSSFEDIRQQSSPQRGIGPATGPSDFAGESPHHLAIRRWRSTLDPASPRRMSGSRRVRSSSAKRSESSFSEPTTRWAIIRAVPISISVVPWSPARSPGASARSCTSPGPLRAWTDPSFAPGMRRQTLRSDDTAMWVGSRGDGREHRPRKLQSSGTVPPARCLGLKRKEGWCYRVS